MKCIRSQCDDPISNPLTILFISTTINVSSFRLLGDRVHSTGIGDWIKRKSTEKSTSNIEDGIGRLVKAVQTHCEILSTAQQVAQMPEAEQDRAAIHWKAALNGVADAQPKLYKDIALWSSLPPEQVFNEVVMPAILWGKFVPPTSPYLPNVVVAAYRVCDVAAEKNGVELASLVDPEITQLIAGAGDLYRQ